MAWRGLEEVDGLSSTKRHWAAACGPALFKVVDPFLVPTGERAEWVPDPTDPLRQMRVIDAVRRQDCEFLGVSEEEPRSPNVPLSAQDLAVYRLDLPRFGRQIAAAMGFSPTRQSALVAPNVARLAPLPSHGLEVVLALPCREDDLLAAVESIRAKIRGEFALITPTNHTVVPRVRAAINSGIFQHATLGELLAIADDGAVTMLWEPAKCFSVAANIESGPPYLRWPHTRPPNANWGHVAIGLREPDTLRIEFGSSVAELSSRDIVGFVKRTPGQHTTEAWELLRRLAESKGTLPIPVGEAEQGRLRSSRKALADLLKRFFEFDSLPYAENRRGKVWSVTFGIGMIR